MDTELLIVALVGWLLAPTLDVIASRQVAEQASPLTLGWMSRVPILGWASNMKHRRDAIRRIGVGITTPLLLASVWAALPNAAWGVLYGVIALGWIVMVLTDLEAQLLRDVVTYPSMLIALVGVVALNLDDPWAIIRSLICGAIWFLMIFTIIMIKPGAMGLGDMKLAVSLGIILGALGAQHFVLGVLSCMLLPLPFLIIAIFMGKLGSEENAAWAFGPFMIGGAAIGVIFGGQAQGIIV